MGKLDLHKQLRRVQLGPVGNWLSTGSTLLDLAIRGRLPGGLPCGRISQLYGSESTGKTVVMEEALGSCLRQTGYVRYEDAEQTFDPDRALLHGLNPDSNQLTYYNPGSVEELFDDEVPDVVDRQRKRKGKTKRPPPAAVGVDSLSALPSLSEIDGALGSGGYQTSRPKVLSTAFRKRIWELSVYNIAMIFIDQTRANIGGFGPSEDTASGKAIKFFASVRIWLTSAKAILNKQKQQVGIRVNFVIRKNKVGVPFRRGFFRYLFDYGMDDITSNVEWLRDAGRKPRERRTFVCCGLKTKTLAGTVKKIEAEGLELQLQAEVEKKWQEIHKSDDLRKPRVRRRGV